MYKINKQGGTIEIKYDNVVCDVLYCPIQIHCFDSCVENPCTPDYLSFKRGKELCAQIDLKKVCEVNGINVEDSTRGEIKDLINACIDELCSPPTLEEIAAGVSVVWACKRGEETKVAIEVCKNQAGEVEYFDGSETMDLATFNANYDCECEPTEVCECTTFAYTAEEGELVDNAELLALAANSPDVIATLGGVPNGISQIKFAAFKSKNADADFVWNGSEVQDLDFGDGFDFKAIDEYSDIPAFSVDVQTGQVRFTYTVFLCE